MKTSTNIDPESNPAWRQSFRRRLRAWYAKHARDLPWRRTRDPYRIWISEIMLQQTTVAAVIPYYERFLAALPGIEALAHANEETVLRLWEGLGYYSRARNLHAAAKKIVHDRSKDFPQSVRDLQKLPGIGRYTAGAIASFAFDQPAPIVEANTLRLYSRLIGLQEDPKSTAGQRRLWSFAEAIVPQKQAGAFNHALMDLGATVCRPADPQCDVCPVRQNCAAFAAGQQHEIPRLPARPAVTDVTEGYLVVARDNRILLRQRAENERWAGLWDFPRYQIPHAPPLPLSPSHSNTIIPTLERDLLVQTNISARILDSFAEIRHGVTRYRIRVICFDAQFQSGSRHPHTRWLQLSELDNYPLSRSGRKLANLLLERAS